MPKITIYTTPTCAYCKMTKAFFKDNGVAYEEKDVTVDDKAREEMIKKSGSMAVPVIDVDGQIVVAFNPEFSPNPKVPPHAKYTIAQYKIGYANLVGALKELNEADPAVTEEAKWGGSAGIIGSPQGISSQLTPEQVSEIVGKYITEN